MTRVCIHKEYIRASSCDTFSQRERFSVTDGLYVCVCVCARVSTNTDMHLQLKVAHGKWKTTNTIDSRDQAISLVYNLQGKLEEKLRENIQENVQTRERKKKLYRLENLN